jgi:cob(I)alamin adenosyltransferase
MKIYTRRGDEGDTDLLGGERVPKTDPRVDAYGTVDELNAALGLALALADDPDDAAISRTVEGLEQVQNDLFTVGSRLAAARPDRDQERGVVPKLPSRRIDALEAWIDELEASLPTLDAFVLPGGDPVGAQLHVARTVCRRAERATVGLASSQPELETVVLPYLNRLSDLLFTLARAVNHRAGVPETEWEPVRRRAPADGEAGRGPDAPENGGSGP